ncbi:MAG: sensor histidine kinase [Sphingobacteriales bacterium]
MKKILTLIFLAFVFSPALAQKVNVDSLIKIVISRNDRAVIPPKRNLDSLVKLIPVTKSPSARIKLIYDVIERNGELNPKQAFYYHHKILDLTRKTHDQVGEAVILSELGYTVSQNGDNPEGLKMIYDALALAEKTGNPDALGCVYDNLGVCINNRELKKTYFRKAIKFSQTAGNNEFLCFELTNLGQQFDFKNQPDSVNFYFLKAFEITVKKGLQVNLPGILTDLAFRQTTAKDTLKYLKMALQLPFTSVDAQTRCSVLGSLSYFYSRERKTDSALWYAKKAYQVSLNSALLNRIGPAHQVANIYKKHNADSALKYTLIYYSARDSATNDSKLIRAQAMGFAEQQKIQDAEAQTKTFQIRVWSFFLAAIILFLVILAFIFWRNNRQKQKANHLLNEQKEEIETQRDDLEQALDELKATQTQLVQREKMASLGELTAGIAHEIQNPLNFVNNFSEVNTELIEEMQEEIGKGNLNDVKEIADSIKQNQQKISQHGKRADFIVKGMLQHSRTNAGEKQETNLNVLADEFLKLSYHGLRAKDKSFNAEMTTNFDPALPKVNVVQQDIGRVLLNLFNNAFYAVNQKQKMSELDYKPEVSVSTSSKGKEVEIRVKDNGSGIPDAIKEKIMQPFFTTKPTGEGTGLGLSLSYDIVVKGHGGKIAVESKEGEGSTFIISLPVQS